MRVRMHRGAHEIGGNCIEIEAEGERIVLDVGRPLSAGWGEEVALPDVSGFAAHDPTLCGVVISHPHQDHYGLVASIATNVPLYMGEEAWRVVGAARFFTGAPALDRPAAWLADRATLRIGPFEVTPYLNDHSAFDAYSLLVEAGGRRLFYTGDLRAHGRKRALFEGLVVAPPTPIHTLMMEGTHVRADSAAHDEATFETEDDLEERLVKLCGATAGAVVMFGSAQNLDRIVTAYRAAKRSDREFVTDLYGATVAEATGRDSIPKPGFPKYSVYVPQRQRVRVKESGEFERVDRIQPYRVFPETLAAQPGRYLMHLPSSAADDLLRGEGSRRAVLGASGVAVWSLWAGYLRERSGQQLVARLDAHGVELVHVHTSGHAAVPDLQRLVSAFAPEVVVPMHSEATDRFADQFPNVVQHADGDWWEV